MVFAVIGGGMVGEICCCCWSFGLWSVATGNINFKPSRVVGWTVSMGVEIPSMASCKYFAFFRIPSWHESCRPRLMHLAQGRASSHVKWAFWQLWQATHKISLKTRKAKSATSSTRQNTSRRCKSGTHHNKRVRGRRGDDWIPLEAFFRFGLPFLSNVTFAAFPFFLDSFCMFPEFPFIMFAGLITCGGSAFKWFSEFISFAKAQSAWYVLGIQRCKSVGRTVCWYWLYDGLCGRRLRRGYAECITDGGVTTLVRRSKARRQRVIVECEDKTGLLRRANSDSWVEGRGADGGEGWSRVGEVKVGWSVGVVFI